MLAGASYGVEGEYNGSLRPKSESGNTTLYGEFRIDNENIFRKYGQVSLISPHVFIPLAKLGLVIVSGFRLESKNEEALKKIQTWADRVKLLDKAQNIARCWVRDGTSVVELSKEQPEQDSGEGQAPIGGITSLEILPMRYITLLPKSVTAGKPSKNLIKGEVTQILLNENTSKKEPEATYSRPEVALFRLFHEGYFVKDILGRETYGIYGVSMLECVDRPIKNLLDLVEGVSGYMRRYGVGRLHINIPLVEELRKQKRYAEAKELLESTIASLRRLGPNEDIVSGGVDAKTLASGQVSNIDTLKQSLETDIHIGLLQAPLSMGKAEGTTYAAGRMSEEDRYIVLESIQNIFIQTLQQEIIDRQLKELNYSAGEVKVVVDKLDQPYVDFRTLTEARMNDDITEEEYREKLGFPKEKPKPAGQQTGAAAEEAEDLSAEIKRIGAAIKAIEDTLRSELKAAGAAQTKELEKFKAELETKLADARKAIKSQ